MRTVSALLATTLVVGCAKDVKPTGPVMTPYERSRDFAKPAASGATYSSQPPLVDSVVPPFMAFGAAFDLDIALGLKNDRIDMIEIARMQTPDGPIWLALESRSETHDQTIVANVENIQNWMPELPVARKSGGLNVEDRTTADGLDLKVTYTNPDNRPVELVLQGDPPSKGAKFRNGNTMGHGENEMLVVLDVSSMESLFNADVRVDDQKVSTRKIAGVVPFQFSMTQAQGGVGIGEYTIAKTGEVPFEDNADYKAAYKWEPPPPPPPAPVFPAPMHVPGAEDPVLLPMDQWTAIPAADATKAIDAQTAKLDACLVAAEAVQPDFAGVAQVDFHVKAADAWSITGHADSTAPFLVIECMQQIVDNWTFDEKLDGKITVTVGKLPEGHTAKNALETAWMAAEAARLAEEAKKAGKKPGEAPKPATPVEPVVPPGEDLLAGDPLADPLAPVAVAPSRYPPLGTFETIHALPNGDKIAQGWNVRRDGKRVFVTQDSGTRTLTYEYIVNGPALELHTVKVENWGQAVPTFAVTFTPALPDLRIPFSGKAKSTFVMDVGGQLGHATGTAEASFADAGAKLVIQPTAPSWAESRPITTQINYADGQAQVRTRRGL